MAPSLVMISLEEFKLFHKMDRRLYTLLTKDLWRDPLESMRIMALWLWLERSSFNKVINKILASPQFLINELADEAMTCLNFPNTTSFLPLSETNDIPLTQSLMDNYISLQFLHENRLTAIHGTARALTEVCVRALADIMQQAIERNAAHHLAETQMLISTLVQPSGFDGLRIDGGGGVDINKPLPPIGSKAAEVVHPDDRTMFVTFSKGYPVGEREIQEFFNRIYGDCIESLYMQEVQPGEQSLFARIVFYSPSSIELILSGVGKAKFTINGKHVWMRKFVPKRRRFSLPPPLLPRPPDMLAGSAPPISP
ncbi:hypothetical protein U1Q18_049566 [Sarracenia purpurea var. burkii]